MGKVAATAVVCAFLAGCSDPASQPAREHASATPASATVAGDESASDRRAFASRGERDGADRGGGRERADEVDPRDLPTPMRDGRPLWTATSRLTSEANAERAFEAHGAEFGVDDMDAYVDAAHAFLAKPPADVLTLTRANGDKLYYAPGDNVFAVAREDGAPRTLFKPDEGMAYWREQEARESERADSGGSRRRDRDQRG